MNIELPEQIHIDTAKISKHLITFIKNQLTSTGYDKLVLGISGGLDSAVVAYLSSEAIGNRNITGVILPYASSDSANIEDARLNIEQLGINRRYVDISPMIDIYFKHNPTEDKNRRGNKMARERMSILYDISAEIGALVIGTSNKSEIMMGYGTLYGDLACALNPIGNLYKTQVRQLATYLGVPERIIAKPPSADLWAGQTDEGELGISYEILDAFLFYYDNLGYDDTKLQQAGFDKSLITNLKSRIAKNRFKGRLPVFADLPE